MKKSDLTRTSQLKRKTGFLFGLLEGYQLKKATKISALIK